jgi:hypothetical protein
MQSQLCRISAVTVMTMVIALVAHTHAITTAGIVNLTGGR